MTSDGEEYSLLVEMRKAKEKAFALYHGFKIDLSSPTSVLQVDNCEYASSAGDSLTWSSNLVQGCIDIFAPEYSPGASCHFANLFGIYGSGDAR